VQNYTLVYYTMPMLYVGILSSRLVCYQKNLEIIWTFNYIICWNLQYFYTFFNSIGYILVQKGIGLVVYFPSLKTVYMY